MSDFHDYQMWTRKYWNDTLDWESQVLHACLGLGSEAGEVLDQIKKPWFSPRQDVHKTVSRGEVAKELGDVLFYLARLADLFNIPLEQVIDTNVGKLEKRYAASQETKEE